jgi:hypothetical protein
VSLLLETKKNILISKHACQAVGTASALDLFLVIRETVKMERIGQKYDIS